MAYVRPTAFTLRFVNTTSRNAFYDVTADLHNRRVTVHFGRIGTEGKTMVRTFATRDEARAYVDRVLETRTKHNYRVAA